MNFELLKTFTILYVEDELTLQNDIVNNILPFVKELITSNNGQAGLDTFSQNRDKFDLIISDISMPIMNGIEMVDNIKKFDSDIPIIYTTAFNDSEYMRKTIEQGVVSYILKPIDIELLLKAIIKASYLIENKNLKQKLQMMNTDLEVQVEIKTQELKYKNSQLHSQLHTDEVTSLANRKSFYKDIKEMSNPLVMLIDIDSFKTINDLYGEKIGNTILIDIGKKLKSIGKEKGCKTYRIGADIFVFLIDEQWTQLECINTASFVRAHIHEHSVYISKYDLELKIDITVGISQEKIDPLEKADMALKQSKSKRLPYLIYTEKYNLDKEYQNDIKWTRIIDTAIKSNSIHAYYQPIVNKDQEIIKYECLMRIEEAGTFHSPFLFLEVAKKTKLYPQLTKSILIKAMQKAKQIQKPININLSIEDLTDSNCILFIRNLLDDYDVADLITFEIVEDESITDFEEVSNFITLMKGFGSNIAIDDFGSGYSNFAYLLKLKPDYIKIDGSLVKNIHIDKNSYLITKSINDFAHNLGIKTVAEYVHCKEVFDMLKDMDVDEFQGFYFSEPLKSI